MKKKVYLAILLGGVLNLKASLHSEMGPPHILDPQGTLIDESWEPPHYPRWNAYKLFSPSKDYKDLQEIARVTMEKMRTLEFQRSPEYDRIAKIHRATQEALTRIYLRDRNKNAQANKKLEEYAFPGSKKKSMQHFDRAIDKSGAFWIHRQGILGQKVDVWVLEDWGTLEDGVYTGDNRARLSSVIKKTQEPLPGSDSTGLRTEGLSHGVGVTGVLYQIAPQAEIHIIGSSTFSKIFNKQGPLYDPKSFSFPLNDIILNWSGAYGNEKTPVWYQVGHIQGFFEDRPGNGDLLVKALPNEDYYAGRAPWNLPETDPTFIEHIIKPYGRQVILAGNFGKYNFSKVFLKDESLRSLAQERLLFACGDDILVPWIGSDSIETKSGTSFAAPIVSGAVALLKSKYPRLTCAEAGDILLESAQKTFWMWGRFIYDPEDFEMEDPADLSHSFAKLFGEGYVTSPKKPLLPRGIEVIPFSSSSYGRGILDLRRAFIYAEIKEKNPGLTPEQLKPLFKVAIKVQENAAARTIQQAFRKMKEKRIS